MSKPILCLDFDGVIHRYTSPWINETTIPDGPVPGTFEWLEKAVELFDVQIYSSRSKSADGIVAMQSWLVGYAIDVLGEEKATQVVNKVKFCHEKPAAFLTIDDRALTFNGDWNRFEPTLLRQFRPWNKS